MDTNTLPSSVVETTQDVAGMPEMPPECLKQVPECLGHCGIPAAQRAPRCGGVVILRPVCHVLAENVMF